MKRLMVLPLFGLLLLGCEAAAPPAGPSLGQDEPEAVLMVGLDLSGSFLDKMLGSDGRAFRYISSAVDKYFRAHQGSACRLVIFQISGEKQALLWDGSPLAFRQQFPSGRAFKKYVTERSNPSSSRVYDSIADGIDYLLAVYPDEQKCRAVTLLFTDMDDNFPGREESERRLVQSLKAYGKRGGALGLFWVNHQRLKDWQGHLKGSGIKKHVIYSEIVADPAIPEWE